MSSRYARRTSNLVGLNLPDVRNDFYAEIAQALSETCDREGHRLELSITNDDRDVEVRHIKELAGARASGVITVPSQQPRREGVRILQGIPHVQLLRQVSSLGDVWFGIDDEAALCEATQYLLTLGHRRIAYLGGPEALSTGADRVRGFRRAFDLMEISRGQSTEWLGPTTAVYGVFATEQMLRSYKPPTAVITSSAHITMGLIQTIEKHGIAVPQQLSLVGFGDPAWFQRDPGAVGVDGRDAGIALDGSTPELAWRGRIVLGIYEYTNSLQSKPPCCRHAQQMRCRPQAS